MFSRYFLSGIILLLAVPVLAQTVKDSNLAGGLNLTLQVRHRVVIPKILYFRIGDETTISKVTFDLANSPSFNAASGTGNNQTHNGVNPLGNGNIIAATSNGTLVIDLRGNSGDVTLSYTIDNPNGLADGAGHFIPFSEISTSSDNAGLLPPVLSNAATNTQVISANLYSGKVVNKQVNWTYTYQNTLIPQAGTYNGRVTYIASAP